MGFVSLEICDTPEGRIKFKKVMKQGTRETSEAVDLFFWLLEQMNAHHPVWETTARIEKKKQKVRKRHLVLVEETEGTT